MTRSAAALILVLLGAAAAAAQAPPAGSTLEGIAVEERRDGAVVRLRTTGRPQHQVLWQEGPPRVVIDLDGARNAWGGGPLGGQPEPIAEIRASQLRPGVTRVVVQLTRTVAYGIQSAPGGLELSLALPRDASGEVVREGRPGAPHPAPSPREPADDRPRLFGVVHGTHGWVAYIHDPATRRVGAYRVGDGLGTTVVERIEPETVVLSGPQGRELLQLGDGRPGLPAGSP
jgi:hypothetical protein